jgi:hypothetical protein
VEILSDCPWAIRGRASTQAIASVTNNTREWDVLILDSLYVKSTPTGLDIICMRETMKS